MTTAYTPILQLALPVTGELNGTWGTVVNDNITSMIEQAIAGLATVNTWVAASHTLTTANGTTDEARCAVLECSGAPGAAATVICPALSKLYVIKNSVTGGYAVTLKTSAGTGISVPNGSTALLYCDGTNVVSGATYMATVSTTQVDILAQGDLRLQDTTGGEYVALQAPATLAASYTLTMPVDDGTSGQALVTDGSGVLSWSTAASGDVYGPASATDSAVATFDGTTGKIIKNNSGVTIAANVVTATGFAGALNGTVGATTASTGKFTTLTDSGLTATRVTYAGTAGLLQDSANLTFDGTTLTAAGFSGPVSGAISATSITDSGNLTFTGTGNRILGDFSNATASNRVAFQSSTTNGQTLVSFLPNGTSQTAQIQVYNNQDPTNAGRGVFQISSTDVNIQSGITGTGTYLPMLFLTGGSERVRVDTSGNVGIGTSSPSAKLDVNGGINLGGSYINLASPNGANGDWVGGYNINYSTGIKNVATGSANGIYESNAGYIAFHTNTSQTAGTAVPERMRIDSSGNVGIGTASPSQKLEVTGGILLSTTNQINFYTTGYFIRASTGFEFQAADFMRFSTNGANERVRIDSSGNLLVGVTASPTGTNNVKNIVITDDISTGSLRIGTQGSFLGRQSSDGSTVLNTGQANIIFSGGAYGSTTEWMRITNNKVSDTYGNIRAVPQSGAAKTASYTLVTTDVGQYIQVSTSGAIVIPNSTFAAGDIVSVFNNTSASATITCSTTTAYVAGTDTNRTSVTLATRGVATILFITSTLCVISGNVT